ncbi:hypothetical protein CC2G_007464 [Coprinopsis cinerea AmutBmut pab1-1]|nr:hypothetical protein CC2G_007464 [Coprinopsis cinerea AmutBmut pab1-1]
MPAVTLIETVPTFVSEEEYKSLIQSTPSSFNDLPPVVKWKGDNVSVVLEPPVEGFTEQDAASGTLLVLTSVLVFVSSTGKAFQVEYPSITLHAVSKSGSKPSIYCQLDEENLVVATEPSTNGAGANGDEEAAEEQEYTDVRELSIIPSSSDSLDPIFEALSDCASLHPDKMDEDDDMDDSAFIASDSTFEVFTGDGDQELSEVGKVRSDFLNDNRYAPY